MARCLHLSVHDHGSRIAPTHSATTGARWFGPIALDVQGFSILAGVTLDQPPAASRRDTVRVLHDDHRPDPYAWLAETGTQETVDHLRAERAFYDRSTDHLRPRMAELADQMAARLAPEESDVPHDRERFTYLESTPPGGDYTQLRRRPRGGSDADEVVLLDPAALLGESGYVELGLTLVSPDENLLAYSLDSTGDEVYELRFRDLTTGADLPETMPRTYYTGAWSADSSTFFYTVHDEKYRPYQLWRHRLGTSTEDDQLVYIEPDEHYNVEVRTCRSGDVIELVTYNRDTTEVWLIDARHPDADARCVEPRTTGLEYRIEHVRSTGPEPTERLLIVTNDGAPEYRLVSAPLAEPGRHSWTELLAEDPAERLYEVTAFASHVVTSLRRDTHLRVRAYPLRDDLTLGEPIDITSSLPVGSLELAENDLFDTDHVTVVEESDIHPKAWYDVALGTGERTLLKRQEVPNYDPALYVSEMVWTEGSPSIPVTLVRRRDTPLDGTAPCLLYAYGAYEACYEPEFDATRTVLLDQGVVYAHAHIRGGGEGGRRWWLEGRLEHKQNTFSDHIAVADFLAGFAVDGDRIVTRGLSAGGLLQGAVFSQRPDRWAGVIAEVPFVDVVTTMLDGSIPLTINEWDEWGDPRRAADYRWMKAYSPIDNLPAAGSRPDLLVTGAMHDPRVMVFEPAKWVAALRHTDPEWSPRCLFRVELGAGAHVGPSGRSGHVNYEAEIYAWALERMAPRA